MDGCAELAAKFSICCFLGSFRIVAFRFMFSHGKWCSLENIMLVFEGAISKMITPLL